MAQETAALHTCAFIPYYCDPSQFLCFRTVFLSCSCICRCRQRDSEGKNAQTDVLAHFTSSLSLLALCSALITRLFFSHSTFLFFNPLFLVLSSVSSLSNFSPRRSCSFAACCLICKSDTESHRHGHYRSMNMCIHIHQEKEKENEGEEEPVKGNRENVGRRRRR